MRRLITPALGLAALCAPISAQAEVTQTSDNGFVTKDVAFVQATPKETWLALIAPADWWSSEHTWSADAANLRLTPQAGGCFCEKIPEVETPDSFTLEGSVEHMRVIQAYPEAALRMVGALGPLQSEPVNGVLTIALTEVDLPGEGAGKGTRIVWEYNVGGSMRYPIPTISKAVDGVMSLQLAGLAKKLGRVEIPEEEPATEASDTQDTSNEKESEEPAAIEPEDTLEEGVQESDRSPSVEDAFGDLADPPSS